MLSEFAVILALVLVNGLFAGAEIAIVGIDRARLRQLVQEGGRGARAVQTLRTQPERFFATVQIVITVVSATAGAFGGATFARDLAPAMVPLVGDSAETVSMVAVVALVSYLSLVLGELVPKSLAMRSAERYGIFIAPPLLWLSRAAKPLVWILTASSNLVLRLFGDRTNFAETRLSANELRTLVDEAAETGALDAHVGELASRALGFAELTAGVVMVPRTRIVAIPRHANPVEIREVLLESPHSRLPVFEGELDNVVGYILYKDLLPLAWEGKLLMLEDLVRPSFFVVEGLRASELLKQMRERHAHMAFVVDGTGGLSGIVTLDDLVEELVGEVFGEQRSTAPASMHRDLDGAIVARGDVAIRDVNREFGLELPESQDWSTLSGLCMSLADRIPRAGDRLQVDEHTALLVEAATDRTVTRVRIFDMKARGDAAIAVER
jgi:putative hemolysin